MTGEITYGLERLAMYAQGIDNVYDLRWNEGGVTYGEVFLQAEREFSAYNFEHADPARLVAHFADAETACNALLERGLSLPPTTTASRRATCSTCSTRAASSG